jgi:hypothetical protein
MNEVQFVFGEPMTLRSQIGVGLIGLLGVLLIGWLLQRRKINEGLFYLWLVVFLGILTVGTSHHVQVWLTRLIGAYDPISTMLLFSLAFLFGATLIFSVVISSLVTRIRDLTGYIAVLRLDLDETREQLAGASAEETLRPEGL